jgi:hypothetical protein
MSNECLRSEQEHDIGTAASERGPDQTTDATRAKDRVSHESDRKPEAPKRCSRLFAALSEYGLRKPERDFRN